MSATALTSRTVSSWFSSGIVGPLSSLLSVPLSLVPSIVFAVPKKKTTHHKKRLRMTQKWLRPMKNIIQCPLCGSPSLLHHSCKTCLRGLKNGV